MPILHIANTQFERELLCPSELKASFSSQSFHIQLQFLPFLYASPEDFVLLFHKPDKHYFESLKQIRPAYPKPIYFDELNLDGITHIESWGASLAIQAWAGKHHIKYRIPDLAIVKQLAAKSFTFSQVPKLPNAKALHSEEKLNAWLDLDFWPKVLKANYGTAGRGHRIIQCKTALHLQDLLKFCHQEWQRGDAVIGEPWVEKQCDYSSQWTIGQTIEYLGSTIMECNRFGTYRGSQVSKDSFFDMHMPLLEQAKKLGFFGQIGIDGFTYDGGEHITEINPRKTMGWVALELSRILKQPQLKMTFVKSKDAQTPLLPFQVDGLPLFKMQLDLMNAAMVN